MRLLDAAVALAVFTATVPVLYWVVPASREPGPTWSTVLTLRSANVFQQRDGTTVSSVLHVECDGERTEIRVDGRIAGGPRDVERVLRGDQVVFGGAVFRAEVAEIGPAREACGLGDRPTPQPTQ